MEQLEVNMQVTEYRSQEKPPRPVIVIAPEAINATQLLGGFCTGLAQNGFNTTLMCSPQYTATPADGRVYTVASHARDVSLRMNAIHEDQGVWPYVVAASTSARIFQESAFAAQTPKVVYFCPISPTGLKDQANDISVAYKLNQAAGFRKFLVSTTLRFVDPGEALANMMKGSDRYIDPDKGLNASSVMKIKNLRDKLLVGEETHVDSVYLARTFLRGLLDPLYQGISLGGKSLIFSSNSFLCPPRVIEKSKNRLSENGGTVEHAHIDDLAYYAPLVEPYLPHTIARIVRFFNE
jgi:hypothetical protein